MQPTWNNAGVAHENGEVEQSHFRFKEAVDQALRVRGSRDFSSRAAYERFVQDLVRNRNLTRQASFQQERASLRPLPHLPLAPCREFRVSVSRFSTIRVLNKTYSVPSRLIGTTVLVRVRAETVEVYVGTKPGPDAATEASGRQRTLSTIAMSSGRWCVSLGRLRTTAIGRTYSPRSRFAAPTMRMSQASALARGSALRACAASSGNDWRQSEVETAISLLLENGQTPTFDAIRDLVRLPQVPVLGQVAVNLQAYDQLLPSQQRRAHA